jgi:hypothetical protein
MIHRQLSIKLPEDLFNRLAKTTSTMRMNKHAFVVSSIEETLNLIDNRDSEKVPLLVMQARMAQDYAQEAPSLLIRSDAGPPEKPRESQSPEQPKSTAKREASLFPVAPLKSQRQRRGAQRETCAAP